MVSKLTLLVGYTTREIQYTVVFKMLVTMWDPKPYQYIFCNLLHLNPLLSSFFLHLKWIIWRILIHCKMQSFLMLIHYNTLL